MAPRIHRTRIPPTWKGGLRRGKERDTMTEYLAKRPEFAAEIRRLSRHLDAMGLFPMRMDRVKRPFDYPCR